MQKLVDALFSFAGSASDEFNKLDALQGDGDLGITLGLMVEALKEAQTESGSLKEWLTTGGTKVRKKAPSTMGVLVSFALTAAGKALEETEPIDEKTYGKLQRVMIDEIKKRGGADVGDRTILDAFVPASEAYDHAIQEGKSLKEALALAKDAAYQGVQATKALSPKTGRASWVGERVVGEADGGALLCYKVYEILSDLQ